MVFSSHVFLFYFLPVTLLIYYLLLKLKVNISWINLFITIASYAFYGWTQPWYVILMFATSLVNYIGGKIISRPGATPRVRNWALALSVIFSLAALGFFKYYMFFMTELNHIIAFLGGKRDFFTVMNVILPIGISFYTFQALSYTVDVWRGDAPPVKDFATFSCFVALFPQLIAGPIIRYNTVAEQLAERSHTWAKFSNGAAIFMLGFCKKILLANASGQVADMVFRADAPDMLSAWWGILAYHFQIYFDFCAYSDMAVGLGRMLGFEFIKNFSGPYLAQSISDFWNRWHISLSTWIRDYLYISLGGNRVSKARNYFNLGISMFLCGLWHGANMTFIIWGIIHGSLLIWERTMGRKPIYRGLPLIPKIIITNIIVMFAWVVFRTPSLGQALGYWGAMIGLGGALPSGGLLSSAVFAPHHVLEMLLCAVLVWQPIQAHTWVDKMNPARFAVVFAVFALAIISLFTQTFNPFLYFQF